MKTGSITGRSARPKNAGHRPTAKVAGAPARAWPLIRTRLEADADPVLAKRYAGVSKSRGKILGIPVPGIRALVREFAANDESMTVTRALRLAESAFRSACREEMLFGIFLLARFNKNLASAIWGRIDRWAESIDNWEICDQIAICVAGEMVARAEASQKARYVAELKKWVVSANPWRRRLAVATTTVLNQKGRADASPALLVCELAIADSDKCVQAAIAWALREACKSDATAVFALLKTHADQMPRTVLRQSSAKLTTAQRAVLGVAPTRK